MKIEGSWKFNLIIFLLIAVSVFCALFIYLWSTPFGVGVNGDSIHYINTARSIIAGDGFQSFGKSITHFPPTYPALLALATLTSNDPMDGARWLHALLFALNVVLIGIGTYFATDRCISASLCSTLLFLSSANMLKLHTFALSEPPFIVFSLLAVLLLVLHIARPSIWLLVSSSFFLGLSLTTRYVGVTLLPPMILALLLFEQKPIKARIRDCLILLAIGVSPLALWFFRNIWVANSLAHRTLAFHPIGISHIKQLVDTVYDFWIPIRCRGYFKIAQLLFAGGLVFTGFVLILKDRIRGKRELNVDTIMQTVIVLFSIIYVTFLFTSISFADAMTPLDNRIMSPVYVFGVIFLVSLCWRVSKFRRHSDLWWCFLAFSFVLICINSDRAISLAINLHSEGSGYTSRTWRNSESIAFVKSLPMGAMIYSNSMQVIHFLTGKEAVSIPRKVTPTSLLSNPNFERQLNVMRKDVVQNEALIVHFDAIERWAFFLPTMEELENVYEIPVLLRLQDGTVYAIKEPEIVPEQSTAFDDRFR